jgi:quercetin dioxygenase-like cupin family protein
MFVKMWFALAVVCVVGTGSCVAQDPTKVEPTHYRLGFENEQVQVVYIHYGPHEKSSLHDHPSGVVVNLSNGHLRFTDQNGATQEIRAIHGEARWFPPFKHRVENLSDTSYDGIYIAIKGRASAAVTSTGEMPAMDAATERMIRPFLLMADLSRNAKAAATPESHPLHAERITQQR